MASKAPTPPYTYPFYGRLIYHLVAFLEGYDLQVVSVCMRAFEMSLKFSPSKLSTMVTVDSMGLLGGALVWGTLADIFQCQFLVAGAAMLTGIANILLASASDYKTVLALRLFHGFGVGAVNPVQPKIISSSEEEKNHPLCYGLLLTMNCIGRIFSAILTTLAASKIWYGHNGWRICYIVLGYIWIFMGSVALVGMKANKGDGAGGASNGSGNTFHWDKLGEAFKKATMYIITLVVFISDAPFCAFTYMVMCGTRGNPDWYRRRRCRGGGQIIKVVGEEYKDYGLLGSGVVCLIIRFGACAFLFLGPAPKGKLLWYHFLVYFTIAATLVTIGSVDRSILTCILEKEVQATAAAVVRSVAGIASSLTLYPLAGYLAEKVFKYTPSSEALENVDEAVKKTNADALRKTMMYIMLIGTAVNAALYLAAMITYSGNKANNNG
ncbi:major facilitator superfamily protein, putative [Babesia ovis]|uniref:Major facilitator superfamily protein, putative n=1 Tax=Babesia ovis TaxID=5869 RepID=A0A9W5TCJ1_BABOV|nr:major facilitator superfamily protein, putative [Babesia ovis]